MRRDTTQLVQVNDDRFINESDISQIMRNGNDVVTFCKDGSSHTMSFSGNLMSDLWWLRLREKIGLKS